MAFLHINTHTTHNSSIRSDEGLTLETSALEFFTVAKLPSSRLGDFRLQCIVIKLQKNLVQKKKKLIHLPFTGQDHTYFMQLAYRTRSRWALFSL